MATLTGSAPGPLGPGRISLDQLIALNDEIKALVRAGVPLERALLDVGGDLSGRLGEITRALGARMNRGESLPEALAGEGDRVPRIYRAVVEAGLRAGRLPTALEGLAGFARGYTEMRRALGMALLYPSVVVLLAYALFLLFVLRVAPRFLAAFESFRVPSRRLLEVLTGLGDSAAYWGPVVPVLLLLLGLWWFRTGRAKALQAGGSGGMLGWVPGVGTMLANSRAAGFAELLALLLEHQVPFHEAIELAAEASGNAAMIRSAREVAEAARRGESIRDSLAGAGPFPPLLRWLIVTAQRQGALVPALRHAADSYRRRALHQAEAVRVFLPTALLFLIGATTTLLYALTLFVPLTTLLNGLLLDR